MKLTIDDIPEPLADLLESIAQTQCNAERRAQDALGRDLDDHEREIIWLAIQRGHGIPEGKLSKSMVRH